MLDSDINAVGIFIVRRFYLLSQRAQLTRPSASDCTSPSEDSFLRLSPSCSRPSSATGCLEPTARSRSTRCRRSTSTARTASRNRTRNRKTSRPSLGPNRLLDSCPLPRLVLLPRARRSLLNRLLSTRLRPLRPRRLVPTLPRPSRSMDKPTTNVIRTTRTGTGSGAVLAGAEEAEEVEEVEEGEEERGNTGGRSCRGRGSTTRPEAGTRTIWSGRSTRRIGTGTQSELLAGFDSEFMCRLATHFLTA